ncbi:helix-turn-helix domain-containing protein [Halosimplex halophilum]|uniref:helix-turn-helix domain-containing protein n=1 Tax=Halosimplex halophilum TaxID=2559572 RepID=UPI00107FC021|nr:helix-turn-helix domain-containing protein [Halosimplex halophilum]
MKFARVRLRFPAEPPLPVHAAMAGCEGVERLRLRFGGVSESGPRTYVTGVTGDVAAMDEALEATPAVLDHEVVADEGDRGLCYVRAAASDLELALHGVFTEGSLVMTTPVDLYPDGEAVFRVLGEPDDLRAAVSEARDLLSVTVERVGEYDGPPERVAAGLTDRQAEAVETALELGYYDVPREATHEDVADALDCAPATASEHLQKAERALVRAAFE